MCYDPGTTSLHPNGMLICLLVVHGEEASLNEKG